MDQPVEQPAGQPVGVRADAGGRLSPRPTARSRSGRARRDRRGRGLRHPLAPPDLPLSQSPAERFDDVVLDAVEALEPRWGEQLAAVDFVVEAVPPDEEPSLDGEPVALARLDPARAAGPGISAMPPRIVVYRRPLEARGADPEDLGDLVLDVIVHELARLLELTPEVIDPEGHAPEQD